MFDLRDCDCGAYSGLQHALRLGPEYDQRERYSLPTGELICARIKIARCAHVKTTGWGRGGMYDRFALLINAQLWDLLYSGLGLALNVVRCRMCEKLDDLTDYSKQRDRLLRERLCLSCDHWATRLAAFGPAHFVADGTFYTIGDEPKRGTPDHCLGFGGCKWIVERQGQTLRTRNLWRGGDVPPHWRDKFPDTAKLSLDHGESSSAFVGTGDP